MFGSLPTECDAIIMKVDGRQLIYSRDHYIKLLSLIPQSWFEVTAIWLVVEDTSLPVANLLELI